MRKLALLATLLITISAPVFAHGGSNLPEGEYPKFEKHMTKTNPTLVEIALYQDDIQIYLNNADSDIQRILDAKAEAVRAYNKKVQEYNKTATVKKSTYY